MRHSFYDYTKTILWQALYIYVMYYLVIEQTNYFMGMLAVCLIGTLLVELFTQGVIFDALKDGAKHYNFSPLYVAKRGPAHKILKKDIPLFFVVMDVITEVLCFHMMVVYFEIARRQAMREQKWASVS
jgi:hypothetical protein